MQSLKPWLFLSCSLHWKSVPTYPDKHLCRNPEVPRTLEEIQMDRLTNRQKNSCWKSNVKELEKGKVSHKLCWNKWSVSISCWELVWQVWLWTFSFIALTINILMGMWLKIKFVGWLLEYVNVCVCVYPFTSLWRLQGDSVDNGTVVPWTCQN